MKHEAAQDLLADFALGLLDGQDEAAVQAHIEGCGDCRGDLQLFLQAGEALAFAPTTVELPAGTAGRIAAGVRVRLDPPHHARTGIAIDALGDGAASVEIG